MAKNPSIIRTSILGTGSSLRAFHYPSVKALPEKFTLHSIFERTDRGRARACAGEGVKVVTSLMEVVEDSEVDLVVIATPDNTHVEYAKAVLEAGKHVLIEKPITIHSAEAIELYELAEKKGLILGVYQNRRWDSDFLTVKDVISSGKLGALNEFTSSYDRYRPLMSKPKSDQPKSWKEDPLENHGILYALGTHTIDQAYLLFGMPESIYCRAWDSRGNGVQECFDLNLYYPPPSGSTAPLTCYIRCNNLSAVDPQLRFLVKGSKGSFIKFGLDPQSRQVAAGLSMTDPMFGVEEEDAWGEIVEGKPGEMDGRIVSRAEIPSRRGNYLALYENLYEAIQARDRSILVVKPEEVIQVLKIIELALQSSREGRVISTSL